MPESLASGAPYSSYRYRNPDHIPLSGGPAGPLHAPMTTAAVVANKPKRRTISFTRSPLCLLVSGETGELRHDRVKLVARLGAVLYLSGRRRHIGALHRHRRIQ